MEIKPNVIIRALEGRCFIGVACASEDRTVNFVSGFETRWTPKAGWTINLSENEDEPDWCAVYAVAETVINHDLDELSLVRFSPQLQ
jgi:hypothetical protein